MAIAKEELQQQIRDLIAADDRAGLAAHLEEAQPYDIAQVIEELDDTERFWLLAALPVELAAEALEHLDYDLQYKLLDHADAAVSRAILAEMSSDALADLAGAMHPRQAEQLLKMLPSGEERTIRALMAYPPHTAGGRMTLDYISVRQNWSVEQVLAHIRKVGHDAEFTANIYVIDNAGRLTGVLSTRELLLADPKSPAAEVMTTQVIAVGAMVDQEEVAQTMATYDFVSLPVVDANNRLLGIVTIDDAIDVLEEEATEDIHRMGGFEPLDADYMKVPFFNLVRKRIVWLIVLFVAQSVTGTILSHYESMLEAVIALAFFIPLLIDTGGNAGAQAATLVIRAMAVGEVAAGDFWRIVWRESRLGLVLGAAMASLAFLWALVLGGNAAIGLTVAVTITAILTVASVVGASLPLLAKKLRFDPAVASAPIVTTIADATGLLIYFTVASWVLGLPS